MDSMAQLESRVGKLETDVKPLFSLPSQMSMLIASSDRTVGSIEKLTERMEQHYVSNDVMALTVKNAVSAVQLWAISAFCIALVTGVSTLYYVTHLVK
jgi:hypothetical protein